MRPTDTALRPANVPRTVVLGKRAETTQEPDFRLRRTRFHGLPAESSSSLHGFGLRIADNGAILMDPAPNPGDKFRLRFRKDGPLRLLSHLDLTRCVERMMRRADLPFKMTQGFHPTPRMVFAQSLSLGVVGEREVLEIELQREFEPEEVRQRLNRQSPAGLHFDSIQRVPMKATAVPRRMVYLIDVPEERVPVLRAKIDELLAQEKVWVDRLKPRPRRLNIRPYLRNLVIPLSPGVETQGVRGASVIMDLWVTGTGTARADELLKLLGIHDLLEAGHTLSRAELELRDEVPPDTPEQPPDGPPDTEPLPIVQDQPYIPSAVAEGDDIPSATWGLSPSGPVVE